MAAMVLTFVQDNTEVNLDNHCLDLTPFCDEATAVGSQKYSLAAVVNHEASDGRTTSGHYTACCKRGDEWWRCDDTRVKQTQAPRGQSSSPYLLFYTRQS